MSVMAILRQQVAPKRRVCSLDDIAKDHVTHTDRRADGGGQNKVETDDRQHGCSLGNEIHYMSGIHTNVTTVQVTFGKARYSYPWDKPQNGGNDPVNVCRCHLRFTVSGWRESGIGSMSEMAIFHQLFSDLRDVRLSILDRPIGPACAVLFEINIDRILFAATLDYPLLLPLSGAGRA